MVLFLYIFIMLATMTLKVSYGQLQACQANCVSSNRLTGPTRMTNTLSHPWKVAQFPLKNSRFCKLGCQFFYPNFPRNTTCKRICGYYYNNNNLPLPRSYLLIDYRKRKTALFIRLFFDRDQGGNVLHHVSVDRSLLKGRCYTKKSFFHWKSKKKKTMGVSIFKVNHSLVRYLFSFYRSVVVGINIYTVFAFYCRNYVLRILYLVRPIQATMLEMDRRKTMSVTATVTPTKDIWKGFSSSPKEKP